MKPNISHILGLTLRAVKFDNTYIIIFANYTSLPSLCRLGNEYNVYSLAGVVYLIIYPNFVNNN